MELGATVCRPRRRVRRLPGARRVRRGRREAEPGRRRRARRERFEDSDRWARGRILAALVAGEPLPATYRPGAAALAPRPDCCATGSPCAAPTARCGCLRDLP